MPNIGAPELIIILVIAVLIVGPGKLPEVGASVGKSIREFRKASSEPDQPPQARGTSDGDGKQRDEATA
jgi:sec-independent protein translocase protein TatA